MFLIKYKILSNFSPSVKKDEGNEEVKVNGEGQCNNKDTIQEVIRYSDASQATSTPLLATNDAVDASSFSPKNYGSTLAANDSINTTKSDLNSSITGNLLINSNILELILSRWALNAKCT